MINVFPNPLKYVEQKGQFSFQDRVVLTIGKSFSNQEFIRLCPELWNQFTAGKSNLEIVITDLDNCASLSTAGVSLDAPLLQDYEYTLRISEEGAAVRYRDDNGFIHGFCTLLQLLSPYHRKANNFTVECCEVFDSPALEFRGVHFCVFPEFSLLFLKKMIRLCGLMKVSHVILEFFGMYRFGCFPYLGWPIAYTREELEPLIADGKAFGIEFIPMFNHIGHATQSRFKAGKSVVLDQAPEYEEYFEPGGWTWNVRNPEVFELQKMAREELCDLFGSGKYFHIGCDETYVWDNRADPMDKDDNENFVSYVNRVADSIKQMGRTPIMWGDMFLDNVEFPHTEYHSNTSSRSGDCERNFAKIDKDIFIADWEYSLKEYSDKTIRYFTQRRDPKSVIMCPWQGFDKISTAARMAKEYGILGMLTTTWNGIPMEIKDLIYGICLMWEPDAEYANKVSWETLKVFAAQNLRKLVPSHGEYMDAGFTENEVNIYLIK